MSKLPTDSKERKDTPIYSGVLAYFPRALAEIAKLSKKGNDKHNPGEPLHWSRNKSTDHKDCIARHLLEAGTIDPEDQEYHDTKLAWRALANLELLLEAEAEKLEAEDASCTGPSCRDCSEDEYSIGSEISGAEAAEYLRGAIGRQVGLGRLTYTSDFRGIRFDFESLKTAYYTNDFSDAGHLLHRYIVLK